MIHFEISPYTGTFKDGFVSIDSTNPTALELQELLQEEIDHMRQSPDEYVPSVDVLMLDILKVWNAKIVEVSRLEGAPGGAVF